MSNKYVDLVEIIKQSRENIRPALQGSIFEREMAKTSAITGEEARIKALEELQQRPQVRITDLQQKKREVEEEDEVKEDDEVEEEVKEEEEAKEDVMTEEEERRLIKATTADISKLKPKFSKIMDVRSGLRYFRIVKDEEGQKKLVVFVKATRKGVGPGVDDGIIFDIPLIKGRLPLDLEKDKLKIFKSLLKNDEAKQKLLERVKEYNPPVAPLSGRGLDPRLLIGAYLAKNNNKQLENLVLNKLL